MLCVGCIHYIMNPKFGDSGFVFWCCEIEDRKEPFPGKGCSGFRAIEPRYEKYIHKETSDG